MASCGTGRRADAGCGGGGGGSSGRHGSYGGAVIRDVPNRAPLVYVCVYRQVLPARQSAWATVDAAAQHHADLSELLRRYRTGNSVYDWGDDPSFFSAEYHDGRAEHAGWGVCRPNVRSKLQPGDVVIYFCARRLQAVTPTEYFYAGVGTVGLRIEDRRRAVWSDGAARELSRLRNHLNVLVRYDADGQVVRYERFAPGHPEDWGNRADSPYIAFDPNRSTFNLKKPLRVAVARPGDMTETWLTGANPRIQMLRDAIFTQLGVQRGLRTSYRGAAHPHINLTRNLALAGVTAERFRERLRQLT